MALDMYGCHKNSLKRFYQLMNKENADVICKLAAFSHHVLQRQTAPELVVIARMELIKLKLVRLRWWWGVNSLTGLCSRCD